MASQAKALSVLVAVEFVAMGAIVLFSAPFESVVWSIPLFLVFLVALLLYSR
ncbi:hypothetical protein [Halorussus halophilus]|uniref:hypothetical protein n=1 Tax=Halorussus halophilus TaxID=2650975 RepID=UPI001787B200|nr:hypothetical protein [Halorussus halophilus]